jgi:enamidase
MKIAIVNLGHIISGDWHDPFVPGDTILTEGDCIARVGSASAAEVEGADIVIHAGGMTAISGLIDSHLHVGK